MFRLTEHRLPHRVVLTLEGRCSSEVVGELEAGWQAALKAAGDDDISVDLSGVLVVDDAARLQLARMYQAGARFIWRGCLMREVVREIAGTGVADIEKGAGS